MKPSPDNLSACSYTLRHTGQPFAELPSIDIPDDDQITFVDKFSPSFSVETPSGTIQCLVTWSSIECTGQEDALSTYGLFSPEWMPGLSGNNKTRQTVIFTGEGPALAVGRFARNQNSSALPYLVVVRRGKRVIIEIPLKPDQKEWLQATRDKLKKPLLLRSANQPQQTNKVISITSRPRLQPGDYAYVHLPGHKNDGLVVMIDRESYSAKGECSVTSLGMPFTFDDGHTEFGACVSLDALRRISRAFFESRPIFKVG